MAYTPVELRHVNLKRGIAGYDRDAVDTLLAEIADSFEEVWRERADLADRVEALETEVTQHRDRATLLSNTLLAAERAAADLKEDANRKAEQVVAEAHAEARSIIRSAIGDREKLLAEIRRLRALLRSALDVVEEGERQYEAEHAAQQPEERPSEPDGGAPQPAAAAEPERRDDWPRRDDTREFEAPQRPSLYLSSEPRDKSA